MCKLVIKKVVLSVLAFLLGMVLCACDANRNETRQTPILEEEKLTYTEESVRQDSLVEAFPQEEKVKMDQEDEIFIRGSIPDGSKEMIKCLFDSIYINQSYIYDIELYETEEELYYKYWFKSPYTGEIDEDPTYLCFWWATGDGLYQAYAIYTEMFDTYYDEKGNEYKKHFRNSFGNFFLINTTTKEVIPQWLFNEDAEDDASYRVENDRYWEVIDMYHGEE